MSATTTPKEGTDPSDLPTTTQPRDMQQSALSQPNCISTPLESSGAISGPISAQAGEPTADSGSVSPQQARDTNLSREDFCDADADDDEEDYDELDELDDLLDQFDNTQISNIETSKGGEASNSALPASQPSLESLDDEFARQLQQGMADLLKEMEDSPEFQAQFDSLVRELDRSAETQPAEAGIHSVDQPISESLVPPGQESINTQNPPSFHDTISRTMERMRESGAEIDTEIADSQSDDFLAEMLRQMQNATGQGGSDEDFSKMLMGMMEQLTNKEILYEPMKELDDKFPNWLIENEGIKAPEEMLGFREQAKLVQEIVLKFEQPYYSDSSEVDREYIVERMQKMQAIGSPPAELLGDTSNGEGLPPDIENCPVQ